LHKERLVTKR